MLLALHAAQRRLIVMLRIVICSRTQTDADLVQALQRHIAAKITASPEGS